MNSHDLQSMLSVDQRATVAKITMATYEALSSCKNEHEVGVFFNYLSNKIQHQAASRVMTINHDFLEVEQEEKPEDANENTKPS